MNTTFADRLRIKELEESLANSTPLQAMVGAGDLAVEKIRAAREELAHRSATFDPKAFREQAQATINERVEALQTEMQSAPERIQALPEKAQALPEKAQEWPAKAQALFADLVSTAFSTYGDLAGRGKTVISSVRGESVVEHVLPVSRPTTAAKKPAAKKPAAKKPAAKRTATKKPAAKKTTKSTASQS
jgi:polyhydroxyalkanoate synthesis regulator phasin